MVNSKKKKTNPKQQQESEKDLTISLITLDTYSVQNLENKEKSWHTNPNYVGIDCLF